VISTIASAASLPRNADGSVGSEVTSRGAVNRTYAPPLVEKPSSVLASTAYAPEIEVGASGFGYIEKST
jgi:hypothetical protein